MFTPAGGDGSETARAHGEGAEGGDAGVYPEEGGVGRRRISIIFWCTSVFCMGGCRCVRLLNRVRKLLVCSPTRAFSPRLNRRESRPSGSQNRICLSSLSQSSFAVLLIPSSGPFEQILSPPRWIL